MCWHWLATDHTITFEWDGTPDCDLAGLTWNFFCLKNRNLLFTSAFGIMLHDTTYFEFYIRQMPSSVESISPLLMKLPKVNKAAKQSYTTMLQGSIEV